MEELSAFHGKLRPLNFKDLDLVLKWRNSERVRSNMFSNHVITPEEHLNYFNSLDRDRNVFLIFEYNQKPVGLVDYKNIDRKNNICHWGFYIGEQDVPPGTGLLMGYLSMEYVFKEMSFRKISSEVLTFNERSIRYHKKIGFKEEGLLRQHILRNNIYEDILLLAIFRDDWALRSELIRAELI